MSARVLVTGAGGFTGRYVVEALLRRGYEVWGIEARPAGRALCRTFRVDLLGPHSELVALLKALRPTHILHLAAQSHVTEASAESHYAVNVIGTERLLSAISASSTGIQGIVLASTANVYGSLAAESIRESYPASPVNHYGFSKLVMERVAQSWFSALPIIIARPFNYTGVGQAKSFLVPKLVHHFAIQAERIRLGNVDVYRDISDVRFVTEAYCRLLHASVPGGVVNICSGRRVSIRGLLEALRRLSGHELSIETDPTLVRPNEIPVLTGDGQLLRRTIGLFDVPTIEETLRWMYEHEVGEVEARRSG